MNTKTVILTALLCVSTFLGAFAQKVESAAVVLEGVGMDVSIRNEGALELRNLYLHLKKNPKIYVHIKSGLYQHRHFMKIKKEKNILRQLF